MGGGERRNAGAHVCYAWPPRPQHQCPDRVHGVRLVLEAYHLPAEQRPKVRRARVIGHHRMRRKDRPEEVVVRAWHHLAQVRDLVPMCPFLVRHAGVRA